MQHIRIRAAMATAQEDSLHRLRCAITFSAVPALGFKPFITAGIHHAEHRYNTQASIEALL
jgi:hypothetical protein